MISNSLKYVIVATLSLLFFTALIFSKTMGEGLYSSKMFYFYFVTSLIAIFSIFYLFTKRDEIRLNFNYLDFFILIYFLYSFIRLLFTEHIPVINNVFLIQALLVIIYFIIKYILKSNNNFYIKPLVYVFLISGFLHSLFGILQQHGIYYIGSLSPGMFKVTGTFGNPAFYSVFSVTIIPFAFAIYYFNRNSKEETLLKYTGLIVFFTSILVLPATNNRAGWLAVFVGVMFVFIKKKEIDKKVLEYLNSKLKKVFALFLSLTLFLFILYGLSLIRPASVAGRLLIWKVSTGMLLDNPLFGIGYDRFEDVYNNYQADYFAGEERSEQEKILTDNVNFAHNDFVEIAAELGLVGLFLFLCILFVALNNKNNDLHSISAKASLISVMVAALFINPFQILPAQINIFFFLAILSEQKNNSKYSVRINKLTYKLISGLLLPLFLYFCMWQYENYIAQNNWEAARVSSYQGNFTRAIKYYRSSFEFLNNNGRFMLNYGGTLKLAGHNKEALKVLEEAKKITSNQNLYILLGDIYSDKKEYINAETNYRTAINIIPHKIYPRYKLMMLYMKNQEYKLAKREAEIILNCKVKVNSIAVKEIKHKAKKMIEKISADID